MNNVQNVLLKLLIPIDFLSSMTMKLDKHLSDWIELKDVIGVSGICHVQIESQTGFILQDDLMITERLHEKLVKLQL